MELKVLETLPNGRKIYERPKTNRSLIKKAAIAINDDWIKNGKNLDLPKPLFQDDVGKFWEIEPGGKSFQTADNPEGYRFGNWVKHLKRGIDRRGRDKAATVLLSEIEAATKSVFPELSKKDNKVFAKALFDLNEQEIVKIIASRKTTEHTDHVRALSKGGLNWYKNLLNIEIPLNLRKGGELLSDADFKDINNPSDRREMILSGLFSDRIKDNPKTNYKVNVIANAFKPKSNTYKKIKLGGAGATILGGFDLFTPGKASTEAFQEAVHHGGSWSEALKTYGSEKKDEFIGTATTAPAFVAASKIPFAAGAFKAAAPAFALYSLVAAADKADDIFLDGATKKFLETYKPGEHIHEGAELTSMKGDFDFKENKSIQYNSNVIQDKETGEWHSYQIPRI